MHVRAKLNTDSSTVRSILHSCHEFSFMWGWRKGASDTCTTRHSTAIELTIHGLLICSIALIRFINPRTIDNRHPYYLLSMLALTRRRSSASSNNYYKYVFRALIRYISSRDHIRMRTLKKLKTSFQYSKLRDQMC